MSWSSLIQMIYLTKDFVSKNSVEFFEEDDEETFFFNFWIVMILSQVKHKQQWTFLNDEWYFDPIWDTDFYIVLSHLDQDVIIDSLNQN